MLNFQGVLNKHRHPCFFEKEKKIHKKMLERFRRVSHIIIRFISNYSIEYSCQIIIKQEKDRRLKKSIFF